ncbi:potassium-transporting ATPase subunit KdpA [Bifidobacterium minimum]|uniref:potassium-transporting ATPase subunit KdpA n=1 Tax=Bifidobacterium minimum TaxID=1693 RepID=UPI0003B54870|nr:potassium-transporting ATPase subunit KdpA [Bifidobacterium minimum]
MVYFYAIAAVLLVVAILAAMYKPFGGYMAWVFTSPKDLAPERWFYRVVGVDSSKSQPWRSYLRGVLAFSLVGLIILYALQRLQQYLPYSLGLGAVSPFLAFNTAASFVTNTNWQSYSPETTVGYTVQLAGLCVQNFLSAAVGIAVAIAFVRGFAQKRQENIGNFWVDMMRAWWRILLPIAFVGALILIALGTIENFHGFVSTATVASGTQQIPGGPVASQEVIKVLGTNGGGFFNANSAHPFENPSVWTNLIQIICMLAIPVSLTRTFGVMVGDVRQGYALAAAMFILWTASFLILIGFESSLHDPAAHLAGGAMEGKETRFGVVWSSVFGTTATGTSTGATDTSYGSFTALGGMMLLLNMMLGEVSPGGVGTGLYGIIVMAVVTVFIAGLLVGRTPEYLGKKIGPHQMKLASLYFLVMPVIVLAGVGLSFAIPGISKGSASVPGFNPGSHGFSEVVYAFTSATNNNGSAFGGLSANTPWLDVALGVAMLLGRFIPIVLTLALAGSMSKQDRITATSGTLRTDTALFVFLLVFVIIIIVALTFFPALALGPLAEGLGA